MAEVAAAAVRGYFSCMSRMSHFVIQAEQAEAEAARSQDDDIQRRYLEIAEGWWELARKAGHVRAPKDKPPVADT